jgi:hypothetical protein
MSRTINRFLLGLIVIEVAVFLVPTTLLYLAGQGWSLYLTLANGTPAFNPGSLRFNSAWFGLTAILLIFGYALFSLWWLVFRFRTRKINEIPKLIWLGIILGSLIAVASSTLLGLSPPTKFISFADTMKTRAAFGGGPLILLVTLLIAMRYREKNPLHRK